MTEPAIPVAPLPGTQTRAWPLALAIGVVSWLILAGTAPQMPIVFDEGEYLFRADRIIDWFRLLVDIDNPRGGIHALSRGTIGDYWLFINWSEGHPAWFAVPIALSKSVLGGLLHPLTAARLGPITVFSIATGGVSLRLMREYGTVAALIAPVTLVTFPRIFGEAHFAAADGQLTAWWLLIWVADSSRQRGSRTAVIVGILVGLTCATKFTGWLALLPVIGSRLLIDDRQRRAELWVLVPAALLVFYAVNPPLWSAPLEGLSQHLGRNLTRVGINIPVVFLGQRYDIHHSLPFLNTVLWTVFVTPLPTLVLGVAGIRYSIATSAAGRAAPASAWISRITKRLPEPILCALLLHWATLIVVRALPGAPPHDGVRLFLPAFGFWCVLAGMGGQRIWKPDVGWQGRAWHRGVIVAALAASAINLARYYPQTLSHYSLVVGGLRGAARIGMEPTYWWDALDEEVLAWLNAHTEPGSTVAFSAISKYNVALLQGWSRLRPQANQGVPFQWYVLQNRPGLLGAGDRHLIDSERPAYAKYAGRQSRSVPPDLEVPLILIFSFDQYQAALLASGPR